MFNEKRPMLYHNYIRALDYFTNNPDLLIELERYVTELVNGKSLKTTRRLNTIITKPLT